MRPIDEVKPYPQNPRVNDAAVDAVAASLKEFGCASWDRRFGGPAGGVRAGAGPTGTE